MSVPTEKQALVYWLVASGMTCRMVGDELGCSPEAVRNLLVKAQQKARRMARVKRHGDKLPVEEKQRRREIINARNRANRAKKKGAE